MINGSNLPITFLAVPIKQDGEVLGVLSAQSKYGNAHRRGSPFSNIDFEFAKSFTQVLSSAIENDQEKQLSELLVNLGNSSNPKKLFSLVIEKIPFLVSSAGCSIFEYRDYSQLLQMPHLTLIASSREGFKKGDDVINLSYRLGEGKTGLCGLTKDTLIVNHFGNGEVSDLMIDGELTRINQGFPNDLVSRLFDNKGFQVGIIHLWRGKKLDKKIQKKFSELCQTQVISNHGLPSRKIERLYGKELEPSWSYAAIPILNQQELFGVITLSRPVSQNPFSSHDIRVIESIAGRLAAVVENIKMQEQRKELFMTLAHEINTPLTGVIAQSENLSNELIGQGDLQSLAQENLQNVLRLHLLTATIMGVLSSQLQYRQFKICNIGSIIESASQLFESEAIYKRCDIQKPRPLDGDFPNIEMYEFDMLIAIKNIIHNAVKYSFSPPNIQERRFIRIWGHNEDVMKMFYSIYVENYGVGILSDEIESRSIFEPYFRGIKSIDRRRTGAGFGLAHARKVIEDMHGGRITVKSEPLAGEAYKTTFKITIPIKQEYRSF